MINNLEKIIGFKIKNPQFFELSLTHSSAVNEANSIKEHNERLEFLGDAVLELIITDFLYKKYPHIQEGVLTSLRASLVKGETLAVVSEELNIGQYLKVSKGEERLGGRSKSSILANTFEALIGAIYLDSGFNNAQKFVTKHLTPKLKDIIKKGDFIDAKSYFQQTAQEKFKLTPQYKEEASSGPDHNKTFIVSVFIDQKKHGTGSGKSKQNAQQAAAKDALEKMGVSNKLSI